MLQKGKKMSDLKPCPFCGGEATHDTNGSEIWVICKKCGARCAGSFFSGKKGVQIVNERWNKRVPEEQQMLVLSPDLTDKQVRDLFDKLRRIQPKVIGAHLTVVNLMELRDRFGKEVADVVADMIFGEEKRWHHE